MRWLLALAAVLVLGACGGGSSGGSTPTGTSPGGPSTSRSPSGSPAARAFLHRYVDPDGRVVRRDQGGDTVSEGQGYALLLAVADGDGPTFRRVWAWTREHLQEPSGLFASRWAGGAVADRNPAADADLQIGWALALGGRRFGDASLTAAARRVGTAVASSEVGYDDSGAPVLAAGPWALRHGSPTVVEPGYWTPPALRVLADVAGDARLRDLVAAGAAQLGRITRDGATLPPDWARIGAGRSGDPVPAPGGGTPVQSGPDGQRAVVWAACDPAGRNLARRWWTILRDTANAAPLTRGLDGAPSSPYPSAVSAVAAAAAASAAGDAHSAAALLARAARIDAGHPTYYGAAWVALGEVLLTSDRLASC
jgi:endoglucanase